MAEPNKSPIKQQIEETQQTTQEYQRIFLSHIPVPLTPHPIDHPQPT